MKKKTRKPRQPQPKSKLYGLRQLCQLIPAHLVSKLSRKHGVDKQARRFSVWSHVVSLIYAQVSRALSLHDVCDSLQIHSGPLSTVRGASAPARNTFSNANRNRNADMAEDLFWSVLGHLQEQSPGFGPPKKRKRGLPRRFKRVIHAIDSTTIRLVANCMDWAKHRRRKAAAKCHLRLDLQSFLPSFAVVGKASEADNRRARELCAGIQPGEIVVFDKAYIDFKHLFDLSQRSVFWVTRAKDNMAFEVKDSLLSKEEKRAAAKARKTMKAEGLAACEAGTILRDDIILLTGEKAAKAHPEFIRLVEAIVEVEGKNVVMRFITNNLDWAPSSICDLYRCRWDIEVFFKQIKQNLKLCDFLGYNENAVRWQVWIALLTYVLLRYAGYGSDWPHSFARLCALVRAILFNKISLRELLVAYGTAGGRFRMIGQPEQAYLPGIFDTIPSANGTATAT
jgi:hypothetical protein